MNEEIIIINKDNKKITVLSVLEALIEYFQYWSYINAITYLDIVNQYRIDKNNKTTRTKTNIKELLKYSFFVKNNITIQE